MRQFIIQGGVPLKGEVEISGAKNAAAAILAAAMLCDGVCVIDNLPYISDVVVMAELIEHMGAKVELSPSGRITIDSSTLENKTPPEHMVSRMRASSYLMGVLLGKWGKANVPPPGGCCIGARPIDLHLKGFKALGAKVEEGNLVSIEADELRGGEVHAEASVGTTINIMFAACRAKGNTTIYSAAKEPHVVDTANFLNNMGARIKGAGTDTIRITGVEALHGCSYTIIPDQIETGTYMIMAAATHGDVLIKNCIPIHMESVSAKLCDAGAIITEGDDWLRVTAPDELARYKP